MRLPDQQALASLLRWQPRFGVVSLYVDVDPADRGEGWRIEIRNGLRAALEAARGGERDARLALEATAKRLEERFPADAPHPEGRAQVGFVEAAAKPGRERWYALQMAPGPTRVAHDRRPLVGPLVAMLDDGAERGVALVSAERVRLLCWRMGVLEELHDWGLEIFSLDWRERKAQRPGDPARVQGAKAAGRDQFEQRLAHNRERFLRECGRLAAGELSARDVRELLVLGEPEHSRELAEGAGAGTESRVVDVHNLISVPTGEVGERVNGLMETLNRERELELVQRVKGEAHGGTRGALGPRETFETLQQGRVEHLLIDATRDWSEVEVHEGGGDLTPAARMVEMALQTSARVTPVEGEPAEALAEAGGVAALLRY